MMKIELNDDTRKDRKPWKWTKLKESRAADVLVVMHEIKDYWPMTVRQIYYRLISSNRTKQPHGFGGVRASMVQLIFMQP